MLLSVIFFIWWLLQYRRISTLLSTVNFLTSSHSFHDLNTDRVLHKHFIPSERNYCSLNNFITALEISSVLCAVQKPGTRFMISVCTSLKWRYLVYCLNLFFEFEANEFLFLYVAQFWSARVYNRHGCKNLTKGRQVNAAVCWRQGSNIAEDWCRNIFFNPRVNLPSHGTCGQCLHYQF